MTVYETVYETVYVTVYVTVNVHPVENLHSLGFKTSSAKLQCPVVLLTL